MNIERMEAAADFIERDSQTPKGAKFDLNVWAGPSEPEIPMYRERFKDKRKIKVDCGTTACALGLLAISGIFEDAGFGYTMAGGINEQDRGYTMVPHIENEHGVLKTGFDAAAVLFDIPMMTAYTLFDGGHYPVTRGAKAEQLVVARMRKEIADEKDRLAKLSADLS